MSVVKILDILVVFPTLFQNWHLKVRRALIIKWIVNHICFSAYFPYGYKQNCYEEICLHRQ